MDVANKVHGLKESPSFSCQERFCVEDDAESCFDLSSEFEFQVTRSPLQLPSLESSRQVPADKLFNDGQIVPLEKLEGNKSYPERSKVVPEAGEERKQEEVRRGNLKAPTSNGSEERDHRETAGQEMDQRLVETSNTSLIDAALHHGFIKNLIKFPTDKIRLAFRSRSKSHNPRSQPEPTPRTKPPLRSSVYKKLLIPIYNWFTSRNKDSDSNGSSGRHMKTRIVEINGKGTMKGVLEAITVGVNSGVRKGVDQRSRPSSAPSSPVHRSAFHVMPVEERRRSVERESSISSAIYHCKLSYGNKT